MPRSNGNDKTETFPVAIVSSRFNQDITDPLLTGAQQRLTELGFSHSQVTSLWVPGAVEIPITVQRLAQTKCYQVIITFGAVIRGETAHFDYVSQQVSQGCQHVSLSYNIPVIFGVLTTFTREQATARVGGAKGHMGVDAVNAAVEMVTLLSQIQ